MKQYLGGCTCGAIRIIAVGEPRRVGTCHCLDCRKHHGAAFYAAAAFDPAAITITGETSSFRDRHFCPTCGSSVFATSDGEIELHLGILDDPNQFTPTYELWTCRREDWINPIKGATQYDKEND